MTSLAAVLAPGSWSVDTSSTSAQFRVRDVLHQPVLGTLPVRSGQVQVAADATVVGVTAELDLDGVSTGNARRDRDLRGHRFFDVQSSPVLRFTAGPARPAGADRWVLPGTLTRGSVRWQVELAVEHLGAGRVRASTSFDRRDAGITVPRPLVGTAVDVTVEALLVAPTPAGATR